MIFRKKNLLLTAIVQTPFEKKALKNDNSSQFYMSISLETKYLQNGFTSKIQF